MPTGLVKSTIQCVGRGPAAGRLRDVQDDGHRSQCLGEAARPGRLLADDAELVGQGFVRQPRLLAAHAQLDQDVVRAVQRRVLVAGDGELAVPAAALQHSAGQPAHDLASLAIDI